MPGPDHAASLEAGEFAELVREVRAAWDAMGDGEKRPRPGEREIMRVARRSLVAARPLPAGHVLEAADLDAKRPGISPMDVDEVIGRRLARAVEEDQLIRPGDMVAVTEAASRSPAR